MLRLSAYNSGMQSRPLSREISGNRVSCIHPTSHLILSSRISNRHIAQRSAHSLGHLRGRKPLQVVSWGFLKKFGLKKPTWLPDFGLKKRQALLQRFLGPIDRSVYEELLSPDFVMVEEGIVERRYSREGKKRRWLYFDCRPIKILGCRVIE